MGLWCSNEMILGTRPGTWYWIGQKVRSGFSVPSSIFFNLLSLLTTLLMTVKPKTVLTFKPLKDERLVFGEWVGCRDISLPY